MDDCDIDEAVFDWVASEWPSRRSSFRRETGIKRNLRMDGVDAEIFMADFAKRFDVDMSDFHFDEHFYNEGGPSVSLWMWLFGKDTRPDVTLGHLVDAAKSKRWSRLDGTVDGS